VTSPLLTSIDLDNALEAYERYGARRDVFAASILTGFGVWQSLGAGGTGFSNDDSWQSLTYDPGNRPRSQEAPTLVIENGAFYIMSVKQIMEGRTRLARNPFPFIMPWWSAPEIDYPSDIELIEKLGRLFLK
jgi:CMP-N-acetylneuraminic acid synthetase